MTSGRLSGFKAIFPIAFLLQEVFFCMTRAEYKIDAPAYISTFRSSCVVMPCKFQYEKSRAQQWTITGIWHLQSNQIFLTNRHDNHNDRAYFLGDLKNGNCSMVINPVHKEDASQFKYRVETDHFKYSYKQYIVLNVQDSPPIPVFDFPSQKLSENRTITVKCSTIYTCYLDAPELVWSSHLGQVTNARTDQGNGIWEVESKQKFITSRHHNGYSLTCQAKYPLGANSKIMNGNLQITYSPEILKESWCRKNVSSVYCECVAIANPPADIRWHIRTLNKTNSNNGFSSHSSTNGFRTVASLKGIMIPHADIWCNASNKEGSLSYNLPLYDSPEILKESRCRRNLTSVYCECVAIANPPADIHWDIHDLSMTNHTNGFSLYSSTSRTRTVATLKGIKIPHTHIWCNASNMEGSMSYSLLVHEKPEIAPESHCQYSLNWIYCQCVVLASPPAVLHWVFGDLHLNQTDHEFTIKSLLVNNKTAVSLEGQVLFPKSVSCSATNEEGSAMSHLPLHVDWQKFILIGGGIILFLILCSIGVVCACRKRRSDKPKQEPIRINSYITMEKITNKGIKKEKNVVVKGEVKKGSQTFNTKVIYPEWNQGDIYANVEPYESDTIYQNEEKYRSGYKEDQPECYPDEECIYANT
ncbi:myelin-associated glycoprotein-like isoform X2 [Pyxicephalus adspersus]|uniref:myelin-associated glycoprotein-like isoform X2 n=1 Tax=Pyxicephalus adspersus TaxID=30357 RepID=UPI003B5A7B97